MRTWYISKRLSYDLFFSLFAFMTWAIVVPSHPPVVRLPFIISSSYAWYLLTHLFEQTCQIRYFAVTDRCKITQSQVFCKMQCSFPT